MPGFGSVLVLYGVHALSLVSQGTQAVPGGPKAGTGLHDTLVQLSSTRDTWLRQWDWRRDVSEIQPDVR